MQKGERLRQLWHFNSAEGMGASHQGQGVLVSSISSSCGRLAHQCGKFDQQSNTNELHTCRAHLTKLSIFRLNLASIFERYSGCTNCPANSRADFFKPALWHWITGPQESNKVGSKKPSMSVCLFIDRTKRNQRTCACKDLYNMLGEFANILGDTNQHSCSAKVVTLLGKPLDYGVRMQQHQVVEQVKADLDLLPFKLLMSFK